MRQLPPQRLRPHYWEQTEEALRGFFKDEIFAPLLAAIEAQTGVELDFANAPSPADERALRAAIRTGRVRFERGEFSGEFDAALTRALRNIGAKWYEREGVFRIPEAIVPAWVKGEAAAARVQAEQLWRKLEALLGQAQVRLEGGQMPLPLDAAAAAAVEAIEDGFKPAAEALGISKRISPATRAEIEKRYQEDVRPYVVKDTAKYIDDLHEVVRANALAGYRFDHLVDDFERLYHVSERKARFLARQETSLFMSHYRRARFTAAGVRRYKWSTSHDRRVRPVDDDQGLKKYGDHRALDGQVFYYETKAPAHFMSSKKPCNPGEDFGCRCADIPIVDD